MSRHSNSEKGLNVEKAERDFEDLLRLFNKHNVKYCIIGAFAVAFHAVPRYTKDMDIFVAASEKNAGNIVGALNEFGFGTLQLSRADFSSEGRIIQLGYEPVRVDIVTSIDGCTFAEVWKGKRVGRYGNEKAYFIGIEELIKNKRASRRKQDQADLEILAAAKKRKKKKR